jgi:predicted RNase H-like nuclease (RuvC/YqgF family)
MKKKAKTIKAPSLKDKGSSLQKVIKDQQKNIAFLSKEIMRLKKKNEKLQQKLVLEKAWVEAERILNIRAQEKIEDLEVELTQITNRNLK